MRRNELLKCMEPLYCTCHEFPTSWWVQSCKFLAYNRRLATENAVNCYVKLPWHFFVPRYMYITCLPMWLSLSLSRKSFVISRITLLTPPRYCLKQWLRLATSLNKGLSQTCTVQSNTERTDSFWSTVPAPCCRIVGQRSTGRTQH